MGNVLCAFKLENRELEENGPFEAFLALTVYTIRNTFQITIQAKPSQLVFGQDMVLPIKLTPDWATIALHKQACISQSNKKENSMRIPDE